MSADLQGSCHCGRLTWVFGGQPEAATICNCTLCRLYGVLWAYDFEGERIEVNLRLAEPQEVAELPLYRFDGAETFDDMPLDGSCVRDRWF